MTTSDSNPLTLKNDICLVQLSAAVSGVPTIMLGSVRSPAGTMAECVGWGKTKFEASATQTIMRQVMLPIVSYSTCTAKGSYTPFAIHTSNVCAGYAAGGKDSCQGDSGGPLFVPGGDDSADLLVGVVSWGDGCAKKKKYGVCKWAYCVACSVKGIFNACLIHRRTADTDLFVHPRRHRDQRLHVVYLKLRRRQEPPHFGGRLRPHVFAALVSATHARPLRASESALAAGRHAGSSAQALEQTQTPHSTPVIIHSARHSSCSSSCPSSGLRPNTVDPVIAAARRHTDSSP